VSRTIQLRLFFLLAPALALAQDLKEFESESRNSHSRTDCTSSYSNATRPVVSFQPYVNAGSVDDPEGKTGLGTCLSTWRSKARDHRHKNWVEEKKASRRSRRFRPFGGEQRKGPVRKGEDCGARKRAQSCIAKADSYVVRIYFHIIEEKAGGSERGNRTRFHRVFLQPAGNA